jgi:predicted RNA polymerase sigma factor
VQLETISRGYDGQTCWVHPRAGAIPGDAPIVVLTMQKLLLTGSDVFFALMAVSMAFGAEAGLALVDRLASEPALSDYHWLPSARGDLLARLGRHPEAAAEFERAASMTRNEQERAMLLERVEGMRG